MHFGESNCSRAGNDTLAFPDEQPGDPVRGSITLPGRADLSAITASYKLKRAYAYSSISGSGSSDLAHNFRLRIVNVLGLRKQITLAAFCCFYGVALFAAQIAGTVTNGTTKKPSSGDDVVLLSLSGGMEEVAHAKSDEQGRFVLNAPDQGGQHLLRVDHQGASYFKPVPPGTNIVDVTIYDAAKTVDKLVSDGRVFRFQTLPGGQLEVSEMFILRNESNPPLTKAGDRSFEFELPAGAEIEDGVAEGPGGMPTSSPPVATGKKDRYGFTFPIRPGRTRFQVIYKVPYAGTREFRVTPELPLAELGIMLPKSMQFSPNDKSFAPAQEEEGMTVFVAKNVSPGKQLRFSISGEGSMPSETAQGGGGAAPQDTAPPGGGLGTPINAPDPLGKSSWYIISIFVLVLGGAGYWLFRMQRRAATAPGGPAVPSAQNSARHSQRFSGPSQSSAISTMNGSGVLEAIKEELFQLETDRVQGKLTDQEYATSKAGLETLMRRQLKKVEVKKR